MNNNQSRPIWIKLLSIKNLKKLAQLITLFIENNNYLESLKAKYPKCRLIDEGVEVFGNCNLGQHVILGSNSTIVDSNLGRYSYISNNSRVLFADVGAFCSIGPYVAIGLERHPIDHVSTHPIFFSNTNPKSKNAWTEGGTFDEAPPRTTIASDVWIGRNTIMTGGQHIGTGAIIAAGSIVTKDVEPYSIVAGCPAKVIRKRFDDTTIEKLLSSEWWKKDEEWLKSHATDFQNLEYFLGSFKKLQ